MNTTREPIFVIGGNGKTGRRVVTRLTDLGWPVTIGSRSSSPAFDWHDANTWTPALKGMNAVYITYQPDVAVPGATDAIKKLTEVAVKAGVKKLVLLSGRGEAEAQECEQIVIGSGLDWTVVRASWFCQNFSEGSFYDPIMAGHVALPVGDVKEPFIDIDDIADVVTAALTEEGHNGKIYEVTGPVMLTFREAIAEIAKATGRPIEFEQVSMEDYAAALAEYQLPPDIIWLITYLFTEVLDGRNQSIHNGVEEALGRKATSFSAYVKKAVEAGAWA
ncbi:NmrA family transcriptional regulator [Chitinophaga barathri]|uniref:NmrA family transcriptional regulator n=2 Tax=Chitinophaga barathri TaxID=1647451 RepID=A0A3N4MGZ6_9BACT|nr:NmrA family transcriptional regulator [Chitinophaga barathri]